MPGKTIKIPSREGGKFDCYLAMADGGGPAPGVVLASAVHGVDADIMAIADELAAGGFIAALRTCSGARFQDRSRMTMTGPSSVRSHGSRESKRAKPTWPTR
jgi:dienelactone hydrolase